MILSRGWPFFTLALSWWLNSVCVFILAQLVFWLGFFVLGLMSSILIPQLARPHSTTTMLLGLVCCTKQQFVSLNNLTFYSCRNSFTFGMYMKFLINVSDMTTYSVNAYKASIRN